MKRLAAGSTLIALAAAAVGSAVAPPARAATSFTILGPKVLFSADDFAFSGCPASYLSSPANGVDSRVVDIHGLAGTAVTVTWTTPVPTTPVQTAIFVRYFTAACTFTPGTGDSDITPGSFVMRPPTNAYWAVFTTQNAVDVTVSY